MPKRKPPSDARGEAREVTSKDLKQFRLAREVLPGSLRRKVADCRRTRSYCRAGQPVEHFAWQS